MAPALIDVATIHDPSPGTIDLSDYLPGLATGDTLFVQFSGQAKTTSINWDTSVTIGLVLGWLKEGEQFLPLPGQSGTPRLAQIVWSRGWSSSVDTVQFTSSSQYDDGWWTIYQFRGLDRAIITWGTSGTKLATTQVPYPFGSWPAKTYPIFTLALGTWGPVSGGTDPGSSWDLAAGTDISTGGTLGFSGYFSTVPNDDPNAWSWEDRHVNHTVQFWYTENPVVGGWGFNLSIGPRGPGWH